jgi:hypothetical protein
MTQTRFLNRYPTSRSSSVAEVVDDLIDSLIPSGGKDLLGRWVFCKTCRGSGYTRKNQSVWQACPDCFAGRCWDSR